MGNFCPFIKDSCRKDCVFFRKLAISGGDVTNCLIAGKLDAINDYQSDQLTEISQKIN